MQDSRLFQRRLAARILGVLSAASFALPQAACGGDSVQGGGTAGGGTPGGAGGGHGASSTGSAGGTGSAEGAGGGSPDGGPGTPDAATGAGGGSGVQRCFDWSPDAGPCPTDGTTVIYEMTHDMCPTGGWDVSKIDSGPVLTGGDLCCYVVELVPCALGGRPFLVEDRARVAPAFRRGGRRGWSAAAAEVGPILEGLSAEERAALADAWTADALFEHASVASFARVSLQLLAVGAPADLLARSHEAALDEIRHARLCFALASAYAGEDVAPGPFPLGAGALAGVSLADLAASTVKEACVGETVAAVTAAEQLARATDPAVRAALVVIAADEARHAELAWRTVAWAVQTGGSEVRAAVQQALAEALDRKEGAALPASTHAAALEAHGRLDAATAARVAASAIAEVVAPAARALLG